MVKLRLRRRGRKKHPFYDIVAIDGRARRDGASIERVGYINPMTNPKTVVLDTERSLYWLGVGAQPTEVVNEIFSREGVNLRKYLAGKGTDQAEIEQQVESHRAKAAARYERLQKRRTQRKAAKKAAANAPAVEEPANEAPADSPEASPAEAASE
jgi:small subunit ribosomal protein S16